MEPRCGSRAAALLAAAALVVATVPTTATAGPSRPPDGGGTVSSAPQEQATGDSVSAAKHRRAPLASGVVQVAPGAVVAGAHISVRTGKGRVKAAPKSWRRTSGKGIYHIRTSGLTRTFTVVAKGGRIRWAGRTTKVRGELRARVHLTQEAASVQALSFGTTLRQRIRKEYPKLSAKQVRRHTDRVLGWPRWTQFAFDDRMNRDYVLPKRLVKKIRASGGLGPLVSRLAKRSARKGIGFRPYGKHSILRTHKPSALQVNANGVSAQGSPFQLFPCIVAFIEPTAAKATECAASIGMAVMDGITSAQQQQQWQTFVDDAQQDYTNIMGALSNLQTTVNNGFATVEVEEYSDAAASAAAITGPIQTALTDLQLASADTCKPPGQAGNPPVSASNPAPCGPMTAVLNKLNDELDPDTPTNVVNDGPSLQQQTMGTDSTMGLLAEGWKASQTAAASGLSPVSNYTQTSLISSGTAAQQAAIEQQWLYWMQSLVTLTANWYNTANACLPQQAAGSTTVTWPSSCQFTMQTLAGLDDNNQCPQAGTLPPCPNSLLAYVDAQMATYPNEVPQNAVVDPSTELMWWNATGSPGVVNAFAFAGNNWLGIVNGTAGANSVGNGTPPVGAAPGSATAGSGPECTSPRTNPTAKTCAGFMSDQWALPSTTFEFSQVEAICTNYTGGTALGNAPTQPTLQGPGTPGLLSSVPAGSSLTGTMAALTAVAPQVFPASGGTIPLPPGASQLAGLGGSVCMQALNQPWNMMIADYTFTCPPSQCGQNDYLQTPQFPDSGGDNSCGSTNGIVSGFFYWNCGTKLDQGRIWMSQGYPQPPHQSATYVDPPISGIGVIPDATVNSLQPVYSWTTPAMNSIPYVTDSTGQAVLVAPVNSACFAWPAPSISQQLQDGLCPGTPNAPTLDPEVGVYAPSGPLAYWTAKVGFEPAASVNNQYIANAYQVQYSTNGGSTWSSAVYDKNTGTNGVQNPVAGVVYFAGMANSSGNGGLTIGPLEQGSSYLFRTSAVSPWGRTGPTVTTKQAVVVPG